MANYTYHISSGASNVAPNFTTLNAALADFAANDRTSSGTLKRVAASSTLTFLFSGMLTLAESDITSTNVIDATTNAGAAVVFDAESNPFNALGNAGSPLGHGNGSFSSFDGINYGGFDRLVITSGGNFTIRNLVLQGSNNSGYAMLSITGTSGTQTATVRNCFFYNTSTGTCSAIEIRFTNVYNCIFYMAGTAATATSGIAVIGDAGSPCVIEQCTVINTNAVGNAIFNENDPLPIVKNNYFGGFALLTNYEIGGWPSGCAGNFTSNATGGDSSITHSVALSTSTGAYFTNITPGSEDLTIGSSSVLKTAGTKLASPADIDIYGRNRGSPTSIGAFDANVSASPVITGPSGTAGASTSTANLAENAAAGPTFSVANDAGSSTLTGTDAALFTVSNLGAGNYRVDPVTPFNYEALPHANPFVVIFNNGSASQTCTITITNVIGATLTSGTASATGTTTASISVSTDTGTGTLFRYVSTNATETIATIKASGTSSTPSGTGVQGPYSVTSLTTGTTYYAHFVQTVSGEDSNLLDTASFVTYLIPSFSVQPSNQTVNSGNTAVFGPVTVLGVPAPTLQWQRSTNSGGTWTDIGGATGTSYTTPSTSVTGGSANSGDQYRVRATNSVQSNVASTAATLTVSASSDITAPTMTGTIAVSNINTVSYTLGWAAGSDNVAVTGYEVSTNNGVSYTSVGNVLTTNITGRTPGTTDQIKVRAYDAAGNRSTPLSTSVVLATSLMVTSIISNGSGTPLASTLFHYTYWAGGRIGAVSGITPVEGTVTSASDGTISISGLPTGNGMLQLAFYATSGTSDATTDKVYYQAVSPA